MTLSVVIPARNAEETLGEALDSLLRQTRGDWQAIVVDDGSADGTARVAREYANRDRRIRLLSDGRPAEGVAAARNRGIATAEGPWLQFLDADDWLSPAFVERMLGALEGSPGARLVYCGYRRATPAGVIGEPQFNAVLAHAPYRVLARECAIAVHACVLDRALALDAGGFDATLRTCEDWDFWIRVARTGVAFLAVPEALAIYRIRDHSLTSDVAPLMADARTVIERAFVHGPADAGLACSAEMAIGYHALWCAARVVGRGGGGATFVRPLPDRWGEVAEACRVVILAGLSVGAGEAPEKLVGDPAFDAGFRALLDAVERATGRPGFARLLAFALEPSLDRRAPIDGQLVVGSSLLVRQDIAALRAIAVPRDVDTLHLAFQRGRRALSRIEAPVFGDLSRRDVTAFALEVVGLATFIAANRLTLRPAFWARLALEVARLGLAIAHARRRRRPVPVRTVRNLMRAATRNAIVAGAGPAGSANETESLRLVAEAQAAAVAAMPLSTPPASAPTTPAPGDRWEAIFARSDPWNYASAYEQLKYRRTLDLLPPGPIGTAMELACAEGRFTEMLASRVGQLIAADISPTALARARDRCAPHPNVDFRRLDLLRDPLPGGLDLLVCSEVLYYVPGLDALRETALRLAEALAPGGRLLTAHALVVSDTPDRTGFDWDEPFGSQTIGQTFAAVPGLALERSLRTELYRIDLFRRLRDSEPAPAPQIETSPLGPPPEPAFARHIVWGGAVVRRAEAQARERTDRLPILMYHRIADTGPPGLARWRLPPAAFAAQMRWLRRNGYHAVTAADLMRHCAAGAPFAGRPVMITFDDAYRDFAEEAWPILQANDLTAEVFVVTDLVGDAARWDAAFGTPAPLMDWPQIQALAQQGVQFGSHLASHSHMADLTSVQIVTEAARSQAMLAHATGRRCVSVAAPFGEADDRFRRIVRHCGYDAAFTTEPGIARLSDDSLHLPRIEVAGDCSLDAFVRALRPDG
ncbi:MAG: glycosyltransferase [Proteobacteria bacterium]|nr:glycosyltransferase [Pseudomonadota bacterium]